MRTGACYFLIGSLAMAFTKAIGQTPAVHQFRSIRPQPDGTISITLTGSAPAADRALFDIFAIEVSRDLMTWTPLPTLLRTNAIPDALVFVDGEAPNHRTRFYRTFTNLLVTPFPKPGGPYAVGTISRLLTDSSRTNRYGVRTNGSFMMSVWYAANAQAGILPAPALDAAVARAAVPGWENYKMHAYLDLAPATNESSYPLVLYSHGYTSDRRDNTHLACEIASHGYFVVSLDHIDAGLTAFPDGRLLRGGDVGTTPSLESRLRDFQFLLSELERLIRDEPFLMGRMDVGRIGVLGFSHGGVTVAEMARTNARVNAVVLLDAAVLSLAPRVLSQGVNAPCLAMASSAQNVLSWASSQQLFNSTATNAILLQLRNTEHGTFSDAAWDPPTDAKRRARSAISALSVSFLNSVLRRAQSQSLSNPTNAFPEIYNFQSK